MKKICVYGKGGIGKSTTVTNVAAAMAEDGLRVAVVGCDPKADTTRCLVGRRIPTVLDQLEAGPGAPVAFAGYRGVLCIESGGPEPGTGCAGRGIAAALREIQSRSLLDGMDVVLYDVLGDVVCGGFAMPIREGYADKVFIVTSGENMAIYAAANIAAAVKSFEARGYASLGGILLNRRGVKREQEKVEELAEDMETEIIGSLDYSPLVGEAEELGKTVMEAYPDSDMAGQYRKMADAVLAACGEEEVKKAYA